MMSLGGVKLDFLDEKRNESQVKLVAYQQKMTLVLQFYD